MITLNYQVNFDIIKTILIGIKTVECRTKKEVQHIKQEDIIHFIINNNKWFEVQVTQIKHYKNSKDFLKDHLATCFPNQQNVKLNINEPVALHIKTYKQNIFKFWHGSQTQLDMIKCFPSNHSPITNFEKVPICFAIADKYVAASFIPTWNDDDFIHGKNGDKWVMIEMYEGAFSKLEVEGYIHRVANQDFYRPLINNTLGLDEEYISTKEQKVLEVIHILNVKEYIKDYFKLKFNKLVWKGDNLLFKTYDGQGKFHHHVMKDSLDPVIIKDGTIIKNEEYAKLAKLMNQEFAYIKEE